MKSANQKSGMSLIELIVSIGIVLFLMALTSVGLNRMIDGGRGASCLSNLRNIGQAMANFSAENNGLLPTFRRQDGVGSKFWVEPGEWLDTYVTGEGMAYKRRLTRCPSDGKAKNPTWADYYSYMSNYYVLQHKKPDGWPVDTARRPVYRWECSDYVAMVDGNEQLAYDGTWGPGAFAYTPGDPIAKVGHRHSGGVNALFVNGSVRWMTRENFWKPELLVPPAALNK